MFGLLSDIFATEKQIAVWRSCFDDIGDGRSKNSEIE
jgi:hypothetical protein